ncbi:hypothetical protein QR680_009240 [Steinernema hermaphroditum]|uniref:CCHC-type domain-containing protein n=1 Tax=Steinernema hermaphroditum TaxID=289476 RepID=A0AA39M9I7_9BILA|nr:hypothetical protein QR680_009240 [Steinernema hermaphroditum]
MHHQAILLITDNLKEYIDNLETIYLQHRGVVESVEEFSPRTNITKMLQTAKDAAVLKEKLTNTITLIESHCDLFHLLIAGAGAEERSSLNERFQALRLKTTTEHSLLNRRALTQQALLWRDDIEKVEDKIITHLSLKDRVRSDNNDKHTSRKRQTTSNKSPTKRRMTSTVGKVIINGKANACVFCGENHFSSDCQNVSSLLERQDICKKRGLCRTCLIPHASPRCNRVDENKRKGRGCYYCRSYDHHSALCPEGPRRTDQNGAATIDDIRRSDDSHRD